MKNLAKTVGLLCLISLFSTGCSQSVGDKMIADSNKSNIQRLANLYEAYMATHSWTGPKNEDEFKKFIAGYDKKLLTTMGVDPSATEKLFLSEKDSKPFKIRYGVKGGFGSMSPVIFEDGTGPRQVAFTGLKLETVDEAKYEQLWKGIVENTSSNQAPSGPGAPPPGVLNRPGGGPPPKKQ